MYYILKTETHRPFSNSIESFLFAFAIYMFAGLQQQSASPAGLASSGSVTAISREPTASRQPSNRGLRLVLFGAIVAAGVFNRPSFLFFTVGEPPLSIDYAHIVMCGVCV